MKRIKTFFGVFALFLVLLLVIWFFQLPASAETLTTVKLTYEQTIALFGRTIPAEYYDGTQWQSCEFEYYAKSDDFVRDGYGLDVQEFNTYILQAEYLGLSQEEIDNLFRYNTFLFYRLNTSSLGTQPSNYGKLQFNIDFSINIRGIKSFREILLGAKENANPTYIENSPYYYDSSINLYPSIESAPVMRRLTPANDLNSTNARVINYIRTPFAHRSINNLNYNQFGYFVAGNAAYWKLDSNSNYVSFDMSGFDFTINNLRPQIFELQNTSEFFTSYVIALSTPIVSDGYILPDDGGGSGSGPDYTDILENNNSLLAQILAKLDLIYQAMIQEDTVQLTTPQKIGFDSEVKQEIIGGLSSGAAMLDSQSIPEAAQNVAGSIWSTSDSLLSAAGLTGVYMFILVGGFISWVIFGKRGG